jgi:hypothetical protein
MRQRINEKKVAGFIVIGLAAVALFTFLVMTLWNLVLVPVVHVGVVSFWQAAGILLLSKILFSGFRGGRPWGSRGGHWKNGLREKWEQMSPEERDRVKQEWRQRCGQWKRNPFESGTPKQTESETV